MCHGRLCVHRNGQTARTRKYVVLRGFGPDHNLGVYNNNVDTIERSMTERYFLCNDGGVYRPAYRVKNSSFRMVEFAKFRELVLCSMPHLPVMSRTQVVQSYRGFKKVAYERARVELSNTPLTKEDSRLKSFSKFEKVDMGKPPRNISPRERRYNLELARYLKHAEHKFFKAINDAFGRHTSATVIKGLNADRSAAILHDKWDRFVDPVAIGLDAKKFDMHVSMTALSYEHSFYKALFPRNKRLNRLLHWQLRNKGVAYADDGNVTFQIEGTRSSGDINTSLGNCILMCAMVWAYTKELGVDVELANNGDDCVVFMERQKEALFKRRLSEWFRMRGFAMTVEPTVDEFEQIEFCQTHPVELSTGWRMVRNIKAVFEKDPMCLLPIANEKALRKWLDAVGTCGGTLCSGVPVLENFYAAMRRYGIHSGNMIEEVYKGRSQLQLADGLQTARINDWARVSFTYAFGINPDEQRELERYFDALQLDLNMEQAIEREALVINPGVNILDEFSC